MHRWSVAFAAVTVPAWFMGCAMPAQAQLLDSLKNAAGVGGGAGSGGGFGGMSMPSVGSASSGNIAGVLRYCVQNNYVDGGGASSVESGLLGKLGSGATRSSQFTSGEQGTLQTGNGQNFSLGSGNGAGGGLKAQMTHKVCGLVLQHAKSLL